MGVTLNVEIGLRERLFLVFGDVYKTEWGRGSEFFITGSVEEENERLLLEYGLLRMP